MRWFLPVLVCGLCISCNRHSVPDSISEEPRRASPDAGTPAETNITVKYSVAVPEKVKGSVELCGKDTKSDRIVDYRQLYTSWHRDGWNECIFRFVTSGACDDARYVH